MNLAIEVRLVGRALERQPFSTWGLNYAYMSMYLYIYINLSIYLSVSIYRSIYLSIYLSDFKSICLYTYLAVEVELVRRALGRKAHRHRLPACAFRVQGLGFKVESLGYGV